MNTVFFFFSEKSNYNLFNISQNDTRILSRNIQFFGMEKFLMKFKSSFFVVVKFYFILSME